VGFIAVRPGFKVGVIVPSDVGGGGNRGGRAVCGAHNNLALRIPNATPLRSRPVRRGRIGFSGGSVVTTSWRLHRKSQRILVTNKQRRTSCRDGAVRRPDPARGSGMREAGPSSGLRGSGRPSPEPLRRWFDPFTKTLNPRSRESMVRLRAVTSADEKAQTAQRMRSTHSAFGSAPAVVTEL
jgi:hypothetical protein